MIAAQVRSGLVPLLAAVGGSPRANRPDESWICGRFDVGAQSALCREVALDLGFDLQRGRLDVSAHPFTGGPGPTDVRMTTRFAEADLLGGLTGAIHETGHALYEQGRNPKHEGLPVSEALSMGVHESQSLLWERSVGLSRPFCAYLRPKLQAAFPQLDAGRGGEALYRAANAVRLPSLIRTEADELSYALHIMLRYELETALLTGGLAVGDLPDAWNQKMRQYLGAVPADDAQGVLQDVHWSAGVIG